MQIDPFPVRLEQELKYALAYAALVSAAANGRLPRDICQRANVGYARNKILLSPSCPMPLCKGSKLAQYSIRETFFIRLASSCAVLFASKVVEKL